MHIVAISGSLRKLSCNTGLLRAIAKSLPAGHTLDLIVPGNLPLFNQDIEQPDLLPDAVKEYRRRLKAADCFLFGLSEYNYSMSGAAKNAIDWGSRGEGGNLFDNKAAAVVSAGGFMGGMRAAAHFRDSSLFLNMHVMNKPELTGRIFSNPSPFNLATGDLVGAEELKLCGAVAEGLIEWTKRVNPKK